MNLVLAKAALSLFSNGPKPLLHYLKKHFGREPRKYPIVQAEFSAYRHACVYVALQHYLADKRRRWTVLGPATTDSDLKLTDIIHPVSFSQQTDGPIQYIDVALSNGGSLSCAQRALYLVRDHNARFAILLGRSKYDDHMLVEVMAKDRRVAEQFLAELRRLADAHSIYKGHVICIKEEIHRELSVGFQSVPVVSRSQLILPDCILNEIERHTLSFSNHRELLLSRGRHLKRGLLLYGPPGTGKSLAIMYLLAKMPDRTTVTLNGSNVRHLEDACALARSLQPATVVIDDVDLVAEERTRRNSNPLLFELLNQMDGIADDADVLFLLSTNRPEILEPALAGRPGRIDQAIMIPLPDEDCRTRLFELYGKGVPLALRSMRTFIEATDGVSGAFIRELFRKAALLAIEEGPDVCVQDKHLADALESLQAKNTLTGRLLGYDSKTGTDAISCN